MEGITREQALLWLREVKQNKRNTVERMKKVVAEEYEKETGLKANFIEVI